jgi:hypothetical protein
VAFNAAIAMTWLMYLALFPMAFIWLRRAWRIFVGRDYREVALKGGEPPLDPGRFAFATGFVNLLAGGVAVAVILGVLLAGWPFDTWTAIAGSTLWCKLIADFALSRHAHAKSRATG